MLTTGKVRFLITSHMQSTLTVEAIVIMLTRSVCKAQSVVFSSPPALGKLYPGGILSSPPFSCSTLHPREKKKGERQKGKEPGMHKWKFNKVQWNTYTICCNIVWFYNLIIILVPDLPMRAFLYSLLLAPQICPFVLLLPASQPITGTESLINTPSSFLSPRLFIFYFFLFSDYVSFLFHGERPAFYFVFCWSNCHLSIGVISL